MAVQKLVKKYFSQLFEKFLRQKNVNLLKPSQIDNFKNTTDNIINCASIARMKECETNKSKAIKNNILGTLNLMKSIRNNKKRKRKKFINSYIYGCRLSTIKKIILGHLKLAIFYGWIKSHRVFKTLYKYILIRIDHDKKSNMYSYSICSPNK